MGQPEVILIQMRTQQQGEDVSICQPLPLANHFYTLFGNTKKALA